MRKKKTREKEKRIMALIYDREEGKIIGRAEVILEVLQELGEVPGELKERILAQKDAEVLKCWMKAAIKADSIDAFEKSI